MNPQKVIWNKRSEGNYEGIFLPKTIAGVMNSLKNFPEFNFYKSLDIDNVNTGVLALHPSVHSFWTRNAVGSSLRKVLDR